MNLLALLPLRDWGYLALAAGMAITGALFVHHERAIGAAKAQAQLEHERAAVAQAAASAAEAERVRYERTLSAQQEAINAAHQTLARMAQDASANASAGRSWGLQLDAYVRASAGRQNPAAAQGSPPARDAVLVLAQLLKRMDARASDLAELADRRGTAGATCERAYNALTAAQP